MEEFVTYILYSEKFDKIYIGFSSHLIERIYSHNVYATKGYTIKYRPWIVINVDFFKTKKEALRREKWLKSGIGRKVVKTAILPHWK